MTANAASCEVLVVEDDREVREELAQCIAGAEGFSVAAALSSSREVSAAIQRGLPFQAAIVDLGLADASGLTVVAALRRAQPRAALLVLTILEDERSINDAIRAGADGHVRKDARPAELLESLRELQLGADPRVERLIAASTPRSAPPGGPSTLTRRELEVLALFARGHSYAEAAAALGLQLGTIQSHVKSIYERLGVSSKAEATALALRLGLID